MQRFLKFSCRSSFALYCRTLTSRQASSSNGTVRMGLPFSFDEKTALDYFNRWRKSFCDWQQTPVTVTQRFLPCWSFSLTGTVYADAYVKRGAWIWGGTEWHPLPDQISVANVNLSNVNVYAAHAYDRQHILEIDMKTNDSLEPINSSLTNDDILEEWTVDRDTAFEIGWDLQIIPKVQELCLKQLKQQKKDEYRITSIRFPIVQETQQLVYFPVYVVEYQYRDKQLQCLINGRTGQVAGFRQFSRLKIAALALGIVYPVCAVSCISLLSFTVYAMTRRVLVIPIALLTTGFTLPIVSFGVFQIARYVRDYSHLYRGKQDIRDWLEFKRQNPHIFTDKSFDQKTAQSTFHRQRTEESKKATFPFEIGPDLYGLLGVSRVASNADIKHAYLLKAKEFHPDRNVGNKQIEEKFKLINQAYAILSDPEQRQLFDEYGYDQVKYK
ncbi:unnamed protein product [Adineta ricciae]|uniref:J domain-containing protein n=1 Tax=Adineta ricciae TaxID=249248 RepID=A0A815WQH1_ADIRI|nr:unnamed protein product [Adineta ricciae]